MLLRGTSRCRVCLRCQYRFLSRDSATSLTRTSIPLSSAGRRWQSAVAKPQDHPQDEEVDETWKGSDQVGRRWKSDIRYRHWQPAPTAKLGVDVLGQPGEILVLPQERLRSRRRFGEDQDDGNEEQEEEVQVTPEAQPNVPRQSLYEALKQEKTPVLLAEVIDEIDALNSEYATKASADGPLSQKEFVQLSTTLAKKFSPEQLIAYVHNQEDMPDDMIESWTHAISKKSKKSIANWIVAELWKYGRSSPVLQPESVVAMGYSRFLLLQKAKLVPDAVRAAVGDDTLQLKYVQNPKPGLQVVGQDEEKVNKAIEIIQQMRSSLLKQSLVVPPWLTEGHKPNANGDSIISYAQRRIMNILSRHPLTVERQKGQWNVHALAKKDVEELQRHITLVSSEVDTVEQFPYICSTTDDTTRVPVYHHVLQASAPEQMYRLATLEHAAESKTQPEIEITENAASELQGLLLKTIPDHPGQTSINPTVQASKIQLSASLEQAIFASYYSEALPQSASAFQRQLPFLPQFTSRLQSIASNFSLRLPKNTIRILYRSTRADLATLEIYAVVTNTRPVTNLEILQIRFAVSSQNAALLLPSRITDLNFSRLHMLPVFQKGSPLDPRYQALVQSIGTALIKPDVPVPLDSETGQPRPQDFNDMATILELDVSSLTIDGTPDKPKANVEKKTVNKKKKKNPEKTASCETDSKNTTFVMSRVDWVQNTLFHIPGDKESPFLLEYKSYSPLHISSGKTPKFKLGIVESPTLYAVNSGSGQHFEPPLVDQDEERFKKFVDAAYSTAVAYDEFVRKRSRKLADRYSPPEVVSSE